MTVQQAERCEKDGGGEMKNGEIYGKWMHPQRQIARMRPYWIIFSWSLIPFEEICYGKRFWGGHRWSLTMKNWRPLSPYFHLVGICVCLASVWNYSAMGSESGKFDEKKLIWLELSKLYHENSEEDLKYFGIEIFKNLCMKESYEFLPKCKFSQQMR